MDNSAVVMDDKERRALWCNKICIYHLHHTSVPCWYAVNIVDCKKRDFKRLYAVYEFEDGIIKGAGVQCKPFDIQD